MAQFVTLSAGFSAGRIITPETMNVQALQFDSRLFRRYQSTLPPVRGNGIFFITAVIAFILSTSVYVVIIGILILFLTDSKPSQ